MISKQATEEDLNGMFTPFGEIEEQSILKDSDGNSKGKIYNIKQNIKVILSSYQILKTFTQP
jgi:hypothetical protein